MASALVPLLEEFSCELTVVDVDADPAALDRFDELVPVLMAGDEELCHYFLDAVRVRAYLERIR